MAFSSVPTVAVGDTWTASAHNQYLRDNMAALFPFTTIGDMAYANSTTTLARLALGAAGRIMYSTGSAPAWLTAGAIGQILKGAGAAAPEWLAKPSVTSLLQNDGSGIIEWIDITTIQAAIPAGIIADFGGASPPAGWLLCDGSAVNRVTYSDLFSAIGVVWGVGDGINTFNLPDLRSRGTIGAGQGSGLSNRVLGASLGAETHALSSAENGSHTHGFTAVTGTFANTNSDGSGVGYTTNAASSGTTGSSGSGTAHNNMQPSGVCLKIIKT